jgi:hypothetical protein
MGHSEPYFAFGRDIFGEYGRTPMAVNYDNNLFQAITQEYLIRFDEKSITAIYALDDTAHENNLVGKVDVATIERELKAMIQSYYSHIEQKDYLVDKIENQEE